MTGVLTLGHILGGTVMDALVRQHRMRGVPALWVPGIDHAGLATQVEVRRHLRREGINFDELDRESALAAIERWRDEHERRIRAQWAAAGFSLDLSRFRYTKDPLSVRATREVFVHLYQKGLIYRGERMVNWDVRLRTAISDLEVKNTEEEAALVHLRYAWADGSAGGLEVATVRPETIFGDVAVAVHPDDERHRDAVGRQVVVPLTDRRVPVITDAAVDPMFGAGALKITPRNDVADFEIFGRHPTLTLPPEILDESGRLIGDWVPPSFRGLDRDDARREVTAALEAAGLVVRTERIRHSVGRSERSDSVIEPRLSTQWFVRMAPLAGPAMEAVRRGEIRIHPERWELTFFRWMEGIQDWCISRQVLWGHPIPAHQCRTCGADVVSADTPVSCPVCGSADLAPDPDVLDTWFTSWLWPFLSLGWPEATDDLARYYPTSVLVTGRDIVFFWVARMMMAGYEFRGARPFDAVYFTGLLRDEQGRTMSKHLGNSPDPLDVVRDHGADTMRFAVLFPNPTDEDGPFGASALTGARNFLTKVWNLVRFARGHISPGGTAPSPPVLGPASLLENRWILSRYRHTLEEVDQALAAYEMTRAATTLHGFVWHDVADRYVEVAKDALFGHRGEVAARETRATLAFLVERTLRLLHPMVPHVTEELWHALPHEGDLLTTAPWPRADEVPSDPEADLAMGAVFEAIRWLRNLRAEEKVPVDVVPKAWARPVGTAVARVLEEKRPTIEKLARVASLGFLRTDEPAPEGSASRVAASGEFFLEIAGASVGAEALDREREKLERLLERTKARLADSTFRDRAPPEVVRETEGKAVELAARIARIDEHLKRATSSPSP